MTDLKRYKMEISYDQYDQPSVQERYDAIAGQWYYADAVDEELKKLKQKIADEQERAGMAIAELKALLQDSQHVHHNCGDTKENCPVLSARLFIAELEKGNDTKET